MVGKRIEVGYIDLGDGTFEVVKRINDRDRRMALCTDEQDAKQIVLSLREEPTPPAVTQEAVDKVREAAEHILYRHEQSKEDVMGWAHCLNEMRRCAKDILALLPRKDGGA